jgi:hypothetical protein
MLIKVDPQSVRVVIASVQALNRHEPTTALHVPAVPLTLKDFHVLNSLDSQGQLKAFPQFRAAVSLAAEQLPRARDSFLGGSMMAWTRKTVKPCSPFFPWWVRKPIAHLFGSPTNKTVNTPHLEISI